MNEEQLRRAHSLGDPKVRKAWLARVPARLRKEHAGWGWTLAWTNLGGVVFRLESPAGEVRFLKLAAGPKAIPLGAEVERLRWARPFLPAPEVLDAGRAKEIDWMLTSGLPGKDATAPEHLADPAATVAALGGGLRRFHELAPMAECPW